MLKKFNQAFHHVCSLSKSGGVNPALFAMERSKEYKKLQKSIRSAISKQIHDFIKTDIFKEIESRIGKADIDEDSEDIYSESDEIEIQESVEKHIKPLSAYLKDAILASYLVLVFNKAGQKFLDTHNIPKDFELTNEKIIKDIQARVATTFKGIDNTTSKWISDKVFAGKEAGITHADIVDDITTSVPDITDYRAEAIVRTETNKAVNESEFTTADMNGATHKDWITVGDDRVSEEDLVNEAQGTIGLNEVFSSGDEMPPSHVNCRCHLEYSFTPYQATIWAGE